MQIDSSFIVISVKNFLNIIPSNVGTTTIKNILIAMLSKEISFEIFSNPNNPKDVITIKGTVITLNKLIIAVSEIERATSPLANDVRILEVTPPGAAAIIINPTASSGVIGNSLANMRAITGSKIIWQLSPTKKSFGCFITLVKSVPVSPRPKENIIKAKANGKKISVIIPII